MYIVYLHVTCIILCISICYTCISLTSKCTCMSICLVRVLPKAAHSHWEWLPWVSCIGIALGVLNTSCTPLRYQYDELTSVFSRRCVSKPSSLQAIAVVLQWLDCIGPAVTTMSHPLAFTSARWNSIARTYRETKHVNCRCLPAAELLAHPDTYMYMLCIRFIFLCLVQHVSSIWLTVNFVKDEYIHILIVFRFSTCTCTCCLWMLTCHVWWSFEMLLIILCTSCLSRCLITEVFV